MYVYVHIIRYKIVNLKIYFSSSNLDTKLGTIFVSYTPFNFQGLLFREMTRKYIYKRTVSDIFCLISLSLCPTVVTCLTILAMSHVNLDQNNIPYKEHLFFFFFFLVFLGPQPWHMEVPSQGSNQNYSCQPTPQPQQHQILVVSATQTTAQSNTESLTH